MVGAAAVFGSRRASPYACTYTTAPSLATATDALGTPVAASTLPAISSTLALASAPNLDWFCAAETAALRESNRIAARKRLLNSVRTGTMANLGNEVML